MIKILKKSLNDIIRKLQYNQNDKTKFKSTMPVAVRNQEKLYDLIYKSIDNNEEGASYVNKEYKNFEFFIAIEFIGSNSFSILLIFSISNP